MIRVAFSLVAVLTAGFVTLVSAVQAQPFAAGLALRDPSGSIWLVTNGGRQKLTVIDVSNEQLNEVPESTAMDHSSASAQQSVAPSSSTRMSNSTPELEARCRQFAVESVFRSLGYASSESTTPAINSLVRLCQGAIQAKGNVGYDCFEWAALRFENDVYNLGYGEGRNARFQSELKICLGE
jgi:hypothetical protein